MTHLEKFRNQYYAHKSFADILKLPPSSDKEFQELFADIIDLLNEANSYFGNSVVFVDDAITDTHDMMNNLLRGEKQRLEEVQVEYISALYEAGRNKWHQL